MTYKQFIEEIKQQLKKELSKKYGKGVLIKNVHRVNDIGIKLRGLSVQKNKKDMIAPTIWLEQAYLDFLDGMKITDIVEYILRGYEQVDQANQVSKEEYEKIGRYQEAKEKLGYILVNGRLREALEEEGIVFDTFYDMLLVYVIRFSRMSEDRDAMARVTKDLVKHWGISLEQMKKDAKENEERIEPARILKLRDEDGEPYELDEAVEENRDFPPIKDLSHIDIVHEFIRTPAMNVTNSKSGHGVEAILQAGVLQKIADAIKSDLIISILMREGAVVIASTKNEEEEIIASIREANTETLKECEEAEILSETILKFNRRTGMLSAIE